MKASFRAYLGSGANYFLTFFTVICAEILWPNAPGYRHTYEKEEAGGNNAQTQILEISFEQKSKKKNLVERKREREREEYMSAADTRESISKGNPLKKLRAGSSHSFRNKLNIR